MLNKIKYISMMCLFTIALPLPVSVVQADLSNEILKAVRDGTRTIRKDVTSLKMVPVPEPPNLNEFIQDRQKAIELGKALFWDMQVGSDNKTACASCHFDAGADSRVKNQTSPGLLQVHQNAKPNKDHTFAYHRGPNSIMRAPDFPRHVKEDPILFNSAVVRDTNDVVSSQGVHWLKTDIYGLFLPDPDGFDVGGINTRRVEPRNTPTVINAVFNHRQFWDGRASNIFNGITPFGENDPNAEVFKKMANGNLEAVKIRLENASLASQAVGPPLSNFEMSIDGLTWQELGEKFTEVSRKKGRRLMGTIRPLGLQKVHRKDSVLGNLSRGDKKGLKVASYATMIQRAFKPEWWSADACVQYNDDGTRTIVNAQVSEHRFNQMEMNFSLFFGLAIQMYESTLISNDSPVDRYLDGDLTALTDPELVGFHIANLEGRCINCHDRGEFTRAAVSRINQQGKTRVRKGDLIDEGFNNIGVRPTLEDLGVGGVDELDNPLSFGRKHQLEPIDPETGPTPEQQVNLGADGAFKIPTLRNVELTAPYFHNGGEATLEDVVDFYFRGGNFRTFDKQPEIDDSHTIIGYSADRTETSHITGLGVLRGPHFDSILPLDDADKASLVAFLKALTDERVRNHQAPFDHPEIVISHGHMYDDYYVIGGYMGNAIDQGFRIPAVGADGLDKPLPTFMERMLTTPAAY